MSDPNEATKAETESVSESENRQPAPTVKTNRPRTNRPGGRSAGLSVLHSTRTCQPDGRDLDTQRSSGSSRRAVKRAVLP